MEISRTSASVCILLMAVAACLAKDHVKSKDMMKKSIVFDKNTPDVFYCPQSKPTGFDKMIVRARPLKKLCEHDGNPLPEDYKSDCYNDVDETSYACKEKYRIMKFMNAFANEDTSGSEKKGRKPMRMHPPGADNVERRHPFERSNDKVVKVKSTSRSKSRRTKNQN
ncbi:Membrane-bound lytic murein transglycosylase F [Frankliniella fusca]|uniref:Membrane-bound lytic murein transglycosylase F n=1 Tax=Frankliniella fusca TaxID=407009 RepID=A0AAE1LST1_9NEOP|nr:Membrane-bound lytic murein transglycosylase F [Frankliniella fusca]